MIFNKSSNGIIGMGLTEQEAEKDLFINANRRLKVHELDPYYQKRRELLAPWLPKAGMLHISTVGGLIVRDGEIINTRTGASVFANDNNFNTFTKVLKLFGTALSYEDIIITCKTEIDMFFQRIDTRYKRVDELETILIIPPQNVYKVNQLYTTRLGFFLCVGEVETGIRIVRGEESSFYMTKAKKDDALHILSYVAYRCGYYLIAEGVRQLYGKEDIFIR